MTFKKGDPWTVKMGKKGAEKTNKLHSKEEMSKKVSESIRKKMKENPEYRRQWVERAKKNASKVFTKEHQRKAGKQSRVQENKKAKELENMFDKVYLPTSICDRICLKNGKIVFVEIKRKDKGGYARYLRPKQKEFKQICDSLGIPYKIVYVAALA